MEFNYQNITFILATLSLLGVVFSIYKHFKDPDVEADKRLCLVEQMLKTERDKNDTLTATQQNHLHTIESKVDKNNENIKSLTNEIVKVSTILEERLPKS